MSQTRHLGRHLLKWRAKYAALEVSDVKKLRQLEDENRRLKQMVAEEALDLQALQAITAKKLVDPRRSERPLSGAPSALAQSATGVPAHRPRSPDAPVSQSTPGG